MGVMFHAVAPHASCYDSDYGGRLVRPSVSRRDHALYQIEPSTMVANMWNRQMNSGSWRIVAVDHLQYADEQRYPPSPSN